MKLIILKQELKATSSKIRYQEKTFEHNRINRKFTYNPKSICQDFKNDKTEIETIPSKEDIEKYWEDIWTKTAPFSDNAAWIITLKIEYCVNAAQNDYVINSKTLKEVILKLQNNKSPGSDGIIGYGFKNLNFYINDLVKLFNSILNNKVDIPTWFTRARTKLMAKISNAHQVENYKPIACQNIISKLYPSCINQFLHDCCNSNKIITNIQAGGKKDVWGCFEQLIINKTILDQVKKNRHSLITIWLGYKKAFDSVPHEWLSSALKLAKVPKKIIESIRTLSKQI